MRRESDDEETTIDAETGEEEQTADAHKLQQKVTKLKKELKSCEEEKRKNLDGWQRAQADLTNAKRRAQEEVSARCEASQNEVIERFLPVLDSFDTAMQGSAWENMDATWREGIEHIRSQFTSVLSALAITVIDPQGEPFDPQVQEAVSQERVDSKHDDHRVLRVLSRGYTRGERLIRPAKVIVGIYEADE